MPNRVPGAFFVVGLAGLGEIAGKVAQRPYVPMLQEDNARTGFFEEPTVRAMLARQRQRTRALERATGQLIPWVFHRDGRPIKYYRRAWKTACKAAGVPHRIPHDLRRTAVRNLERAGVPRSAAMKMVGHRTEAIYRRYAIADERMLREGAAKLEALLQAQRGVTRVVVPMRSGKVMAKFPGGDMPLEGRSVAQVCEGMEARMVGWDGIEPPTPGFSVSPGDPDDGPPSSDIAGDPTG